MGRGQSPVARAEVVGLVQEESMLQALEAIVDERGQVRLTEPIELPAGRRTLVIILSVSLLRPVQL